MLYPLTEKVKDFFRNKMNSIDPIICNDQHIATIIRPFVMTYGTTNIAQDSNYQQLGFKSYPKRRRMAELIKKVAGWGLKVSTSALSTTPILFCSKLVHGTGLYAPYYSYPS